MLRQRVITALVLGLLVILVVLAVPHPITVAVLSLLVLAGAWEWSAFPGFYPVFSPPGVTWRLIAAVPGRDLVCGRPATASRT